jgi:serine/threonine protein phosphatase PrpC
VTSTSTHRVQAGRPRDEDLDFFGLTHTGLVRKDNQDQFLFCTVHRAMRLGGTSLPNPELLETRSQRLASIGMVADGVGGRAGGEVASRAAVEAITEYIIHSIHSFYAETGNESDFLDSLREGAGLCHEAVLAHARETDERGMATTLTVLVAVWPRLYVLHIGDSRCYRYRQGELTQLTRDQTMAQALVDSGVLPVERMAQSPFAHTLSSSLGGRTSAPEVTAADLEAGDVILLCTDGLTKHVPDQQIAARLGRIESSEQAARALVDDALAGGGSDNVTVVLLRTRNG